MSKRVWVRTVEDGLSGQSGAGHQRTPEVNIDVEYPLGVASGQSLEKPSLRRHHCYPSALVGQKVGYGLEGRIISK